MTFLLTHISNGQANDLPQPFTADGLHALISRLLADNLIESIIINTTDAGEIVLVKD